MNRDMKKVSPAMFHPSQNENVSGLHSKIARPSVRTMDMRSNSTNRALSPISSSPVMLADGGDVSEAARKQQGLESSKGESVGFFERLRMGNIDDPRSEAYRRFGAGRAAASSDNDADNAAASRPLSDPMADKDDSVAPKAAEAPKAAVKAEVPTAPKKPAKRAVSAPAKPAAKTASPSASKPSGMSLVQRLGREYAELEAQARRAESMEGASPQSKAAIRRLADDKRRAYEAATSAEKSGRSVVRRG